MKEKEIQITFNPRTRVTLARMFEDGTEVRRAKTKCSKRDEPEFLLGALISVMRLSRKPDSNIPEPEQCHPADKKEPTPSVVSDEDVQGDYDLFYCTKDERYKRGEFYQVEKEKHLVAICPVREYRHVFHNGEQEDSQFVEDIQRHTDHLYRCIPFNQHPGTYAVMDPNCRRFSSGSFFADPLFVKNADEWFVTLSKVPYGKTVRYELPENLYTLEHYRGEDE